MDSRHRPIISRADSRTAYLPGPSVSPTFEERRQSTDRQAMKEQLQRVESTEKHLDRDRPNNSRKRSAGRSHLVDITLEPRQLLNGACPNRVRSSSETNCGLRGNRLQAPNYDEANREELARKKTRGSDDVINVDRDGSNVTERCARIEQRNKLFYREEESGTPSGVQEVSLADGHQLHQGQNESPCPRNHSKETSGTGANCHVPETIRAGDNQSSPRVASIQQFSLDSAASETATQEDAECRMIRPWERIVFEKETTVKALSSMLASQVGMVVLQYSGLTSNGLREVGDELMKLRHISRFEGHNNLLCEIPSEMKPVCERVAFLKLSANRISSLPDWFCDCVNLEQVNLSDNKLKCLPEEFCQLMRLQVLLLGSNCIETLPSKLGELRHLQILNVRKNKLRDLPNDFGSHNEALIVLDISFNRHFDCGLPKACGELPSLGDLNIKGTKLHERLRAKEKKMGATELARFLAGKTQSELLNLGGRTTENSRAAEAASAAAALAFGAIE